MKKTQIKKPLNTINLAEEVNKGFSKIDQLDARLERYSTAKHRALENLQTLDETVPLSVEHGIAITKAVERLKGCGNYLTFHHYYTVGAVKLAKARFCMQTLLCPFCAMRRASRTLEAYLTRYRILKAVNPTWRLSMITLTVKNGNDLAERFKTS